MEISENRFSGLFKRAFIYLSIIIFFISFNFKDTPSPFGWYQQFLPNLNGRIITDICFLDSLTGWGVTNAKNLSVDTAYVLKTTNGGDNWVIQYKKIQTGGGFSSYLRVYFLNQNTGFTCGVNGIFKSTNGGTNWISIEASGNTYEDMSILNQDTLWIVSSESLMGGVFRTTNGGLNWTQQFSDGPDNPNKIYMFNARIGFISDNTNWSGIKKTTNGGYNWFVVVPSPNEGFNDMNFIDSLTGWKSTGYPDSSMKKTTNGGLNWIIQILPHGGYISNLAGIVNFSIINKDTLWGVGNYIRYPNNQVRPMLYRTTNGGNDWQYQIPDTSLIHISGSCWFINFVNKSIGWAYTYNLKNGIHTITGGDTIFFTGILQKSTKIPIQFVLKQNYPNPFNPRTVIGYELKKAGDIKIKVYSITGSEVFTLVNQRQTAGVYEVDMPGIGLSSGVYFYSLLVDNKRIDSKSMVLIK